MHHHSGDMTVRCWLSTNLFWRLSAGSHDNSSPPLCLISAQLPCSNTSTPDVCFAIFLSCTQFSPTWQAALVNSQEARSLTIKATSPMEEKLMLERLSNVSVFLDHLHVMPADPFLQTTSALQSTDPSVLSTRSRSQVNLVPARQSVVKLASTAMSSP